MAAPTCSCTPNMPEWHAADCKPAGYGSMGGFIVGGGHGPAGDGGPGIPVESELERSGDRRFAGRHRVFMLRWQVCCGDPDFCVVTET